VTANEFRKLALGLPETEEDEHMGHPDFRVGGKIFATLGAPDKEWGMVKLAPDEQSEFMRAEPEVFKPVKGGWGRRGATNVFLKAGTEATVRPALFAAWRNIAPKKLAEKYEE
jgi:hypothetical protein